jgi:2-dehydropantoate 2-reductase
MNKQRVLVIGAGAVGGFYGGKLFQAGCDVSLVCRSDYHVVSKQGFSIISPTGDFSYRPKVFKCIADVSGDFDVVLVTTKVLPESAVHQEILSVVGPQSMIVLLQNGIEIERPFVEQFPNHLLVSGLAFVCLSRIKLGYILHQHIGRLVFGKFPEGTDARIDDFVSLFQQDVS